MSSRRVCGAVKPSRKVLFRAVVNSNRLGASAFEPSTHVIDRPGISLSSISYHHAAILFIPGPDNTEFR